MITITFLEILYLAIVSLVLGYIFYDRIGLHTPKKEDDIIKSYSKGFDWESFWFAALVTAPGVVLHELMHKFVALFFGLFAVFKIFPLGLGIAIILKLVNSPLLIIAPGYVEISGPAGALEGFLISFAGPAINLVLFLVAHMLLRSKRRYSRKTHVFLALTKQVNLILFVFNMIPIPPLDGFKVFTNLFEILF